MKYIIQAIVGLALIAAGAALWNWYKPTGPLTTSEYITPAKVSKAAKIKTVKKPGPKEIVVLDKDKAVEKLKLPEAIAQNPDKQVVATAEIPPYKGKTDVVAITDTKTGATEMIAKQQPVPLFGFENQKEIGIRIGTGTDGMAGTVYGRWTFVRVGNVYLAVYADATAYPNGVKRTVDAKGQIEVSYRW